MGILSFNYDGLHTKASLLFCLEFVIMLNISISVPFNISILWRRGASRCPCIAYGQVCSCKDGGTELHSQISRMEYSKSTPLYTTYPRKGSVFSRTYIKPAQDFPELLVNRWSGFLLKYLCRAFTKHYAVASSFVCPTTTKS